MKKLILRFMSFIIINIPFFALAIETTSDERGFIEYVKNNNYQEEISKEIQLKIYNKFTIFFKNYVPFERFSYLNLSQQTKLLGLPYEKFIAAMKYQEDFDNYYKTNFSYYDYWQQGPSDNDIRETYNYWITKIYEKEFKDKFREYHNKGIEIPQKAIESAIKARNHTKIALQSLTSYFGQAIIYARNLYNYGSIYGPYSSTSICLSDWLCFDDHFDENVPLLEKYAYKAFKTDGSDLGLKGNDFGLLIEIADDLNKTCKYGYKIYPEGISKEYISCIKSDQNNANCDNLLELSQVTCN